MRIVTRWTSFDPLGRYWGPTACRHCVHSNTNCRCRREFSLRKSRMPSNLLLIRPGRGGITRIAVRMKAPTMAQRVAPGRVLIIEPDAEEASGNNAGSQDQQHQSSSENDAFSVRHSAAPQKKKQDGATPLLLREAQIQEHMRWDRSDSSNDEIMVSFVMSCRSSTSKQVFISFVGIPIPSKANCPEIGFFAESGLPTKALSSTLLSSAHW